LKRGALDQLEGQPRRSLVLPRALARQGQLEEAIRAAQLAADWEKDPEALRAIQASLAEWRAADSGPRRER